MSQRFESIKGVKEYKYYIQICSDSVLRMNPKSVKDVLLILAPWSSRPALVIKTNFVF